MKMSPLLLWGLLWTMAQTNEDRWKELRSKGKEVDLRLDRVAMTVRGWTDLLIQKGLKEFLGPRTAHILTDDIYWLQFTFLQTTSPQAQRHTISTYLKMMNDMPPGEYKIVHVIDKIPMAAYANTPLSWVEKQVARLENYIHPNNGAVCAITGPWMDRQILLEEAADGSGSEVQGSEPVL